MKTTTIVMCWMGSLAAVVAGGPEIGMRVAPPSERGYTVEAVRESGERGGLLLTVGDKFTAADNREMGDAMELWNAHRWAEAVSALRTIWQQHPDSPWAAEAELHEACYLKYNSRYDEAEDRFLSVLKKHPGAAEMRNKVLRYLPHLYAQTGRYQTGFDLLDEMAKLPLGWQEQQYLENYRRIFARALAKDNADRLCGTKALAVALAAQNDQGEALRNVSLESIFNRHAWARQKAAHAAGFSLQELAELSGAQPVELDLAGLRAAVTPGRPVLVHLQSPSEPKCFDVFGKPLRGKEPEKLLSGHFVVVERVTETHVDLLDPDGGRVRWPVNHFRYRWSGAALRLPGQAWTQGQAVARERATELRGGCCGSPPPDPPDDCDGGSGEGNSGSGTEAAMVNSAACPSGTCGGGGRPNNPNDPNDPNQPPPCCEEEQAEESEPEATTQQASGRGFGAPSYRFGLSSANLSLKDIPMWTTEAKGPRMNLQLIYNRVATERMAQYSNANYYAFGNKWHFNFFSHFTETPDGSADIILPGGRVQRFASGESGYTAADIWNQNSLAKTNQSFVLTFKATGNKWYFNTNTAVGQRLEKIEDRYSNAVTLNYETASGRLTNVTDAIGRYFRLFYNASGYVTNITDSFGRATLFNYEGGDLVALTDMGGLTTTIQYDTNHWPTHITYPSGNAWQVHYTHGQDALYPGYWQPFRMQVEDPLGQTNEYFYHGFDYMGPITTRDAAGNNRLSATKTVGGGDGVSGAQRTFLQGVNAIAVPPPYFTGVSDQWVHRTYDADANPIEVAVANQPYPVSVGYDNNEGSWTTDVLTTNLFDASHNLLSSTLLTNDAATATLQVVGTWTNWYDAKDNLLGAKNPRNQITRYGYDAQDQLKAVTNALGFFTLMSYDPNGNLTNLVDTLLRTNRWTYDANGRNYETLYADGLRLSRGYDAIGRVNAVTNDGSGLRLSYFYDNLNRMRDVVFPDGTSNHFEYSCCGLDWTRDRLNRATYYGRDAIGRTIAVTNPQNHVVEFRYNGANQITNLMTWVEGQKREKHFDYTSTNGASRLTQVTTPMGKLIRYDYTFRGGLAWRQDGNGRVTKFEYDPLGRLVRVADTNDVTLVEMAYDVLGNVTHVASTNSVFDYTYDPLNRATNAVCLLTNIPGFATVKYQIAYRFDPVGNVTNRLITGLTGFTDSIETRYQYDVMNRLTNVVQLTNAASTASAWYSYDAAGRLWKKGYGNGDVVTHSYDTESRLLSLGITNNTTPVWWYRYGWDNGGNILAITNNGTNVSLYGYDRAGQLTNEVCLTNGIAGGTTNAWQYDEAGNWRTGDGKWRLYNADNELVGIATSNAPVSIPVTVTGEVSPGPQSNKWYNTWASTRGVSAQVSQANGTFSLANVPLYPGTNDLAVTVTDVSGNTTQQVRTVSRPLPETFRYDGNGNLTNWISGTTNWVYEWDWLDQLTTVRSNGVVVLENWYDAGGSRVAKKELVGGQTKYALYVWDGWASAAVLDESAHVLETLTRGPGVGGDIGTVVAVTHHAESATNGIVYVHHNLRGDVNISRSSTTTIGIYGYSAFGNLRTQLGMDICRFKGGSKERDPSTGFSYYGNRFYSPAWQRWTSQDPAWGLVTRNSYIFVANRPIDRIDYTGEEEQPQDPGKWPPDDKRMPKLPGPGGKSDDVKCYTVEDLKKNKEKLPDELKNSPVVEKALKGLEKTSCKCGKNSTMSLCIVEGGGIGTGVGVVFKCKPKKW